MKKLLIISIVILLSALALFVSQYYLLVDHKLHVVFCSVGQGDSMLITTPSQKHVIIDGGPDDSVLGCLGRHLPFWQREISVMLLTHPHADHVIGMHYLVERYTIKHFVREDLANTTAAYRSLLDKIKSQHIPEKVVYAGDQFSINDGVSFHILGPTSEYLAQTSPGGKIGETSEFASVITRLDFGNFSALFTGDSQADGLEKATAGQARLTVLQVPHHGSATGLTSDLVSRLFPQLAVVSVGKNKYGHPTPQTLSLFSNENIPLLRTDRAGDIEIVSDGKTWEVKK